MDRLFLYSSLDTLFDEKGKILDLQHRILEPYKRGGIIDFQNLKTKDIPCKNDTLFLFFIKDSLVKSAAWDSIVNNQMFEFKLGYTEKDLKKINWSITID